MLKECTKQFPDDLVLLKTWYQEDLNTVPSVYILRPISTVYHNFNNKVPAIQSLDHAKVTFMVKVILCDFCVCLNCQINVGIMNFVA